MPTPFSLFTDARFVRFRRRYSRTNDRIREREREDESTNDSEFRLGRGIETSKLILSDPIARKIVQRACSTVEIIVYDYGDPSTVETIHRCNLDEPGRSLISYRSFTRDIDREIVRHDPFNYAANGVHFTIAPHLPLVTQSGREKRAVARNEDLEAYAGGPRRRFLINIPRVIARGSRRRRFR